ncbi:hypothetical protein [Nonomuraea fuscirosea]|uniref:hypothetical protein n=1 Tax=Nonomuraea fuscirosea TaxID=1291556 RepID=UPI0033DEBF13
MTSYCAAAPAADLPPQAAMTTFHRRRLTEEAAEASSYQACQRLRLPTIRGPFVELTAAALRDQTSYLGFLAELLRAECDYRARMMRGPVARGRARSTDVGHLSPSCWPTQTDSSGGCTFASLPSQATSLDRQRR